MLQLGFIIAFVSFVHCESSLRRLQSVDGNAVSVSGISAGGAFATQFHVAFSESVMGVGMVAGVPYYCAKGNIIIATTTCMSLASNINVDSLIEKALGWSGSDVDDVSNMEGDKVYIWHGTNDFTVNNAASDKAVQFYEHFNADIVSNLDMEAGHGFPTLDYGVACGLSVSPYINKCNYNAAYEMLNHIYGGNLILGTSYDDTRLSRFEQGSYHSGLHFDDQGYIYIPTGCEAQPRRVDCEEDSFGEVLNTAGAGGDGHPEVDSLSSCQALCVSQEDCTAVDYDMKTTPYLGTRCWLHTRDQPDMIPEDCVHHFPLHRCDNPSPPGSTATPPSGECRLHVSFHGCQQGDQEIGDEFVRHAGYLEVAEANQIVMLFPQVRSSLLTNPNGCFDWWGYDETGIITTGYATRDGEQMVAVKKMVDAILAA